MYYLLQCILCLHWLIVIYSCITKHPEFSLRPNLHMHLIVHCGMFPGWSWITFGPIAPSSLYQSIGIMPQQHVCTSIIFTVQILTFILLSVFHTPIPIHPLLFLFSLIHPGSSYSHILKLLGSLQFDSLL